MSKEKFDAIVVGVRAFNTSERLRAAHDALFTQLGGLREVGITSDEDFDEPEVPEYLLAERRLTDVGIGAPALIVGQSFLIIFREGLEVVLLDKGPQVTLSRLSPSRALARVLGSGLGLDAPGRRSPLQQLER